MTTTAHAPQILDPADEHAATMNSWSDRRPATIVKRTAKTIVVQEDNVASFGGSHADGHGAVDIFTRDYDSPLRTYSLRANGRWVAKGQPANARGCSLTVGVRSTYRDPSF